MKNLEKRPSVGALNLFLPGDLNVILLGRVALISTVLPLIMSLWQLGAGRIVSGLLLLLIAFSITVAAITFNRESFNERRLNVSISIVALLMLGVGLVSGLEAPAVTLLIPLLPFFAAAIGAKRSAIVWMVLAFGMMFIIYISGKNHAIPVMEQQTDFTLIYVYAAGMLSLALSVVGYTLMGKRSAYLSTLNERKQSLERSIDEANRANEAKSRFLSRMSHELRTPLSVIIGFADLLSIDTKTPLPEIQRERIRQIESSGRRSLELIDDALEINRNLKE